MTDRSINLTQFPTHTSPTFQLPTSQLSTFQLPNFQTIQLSNFQPPPCQPSTSNSSSSYPYPHLHQYQIITEGEVWRGRHFAPFKKHRKNVGFERPTGGALWEIHVGAMSIMYGCPWIRFFDLCRTRDSAKSFRSVTFSALNDRASSESHFDPQNDPETVRGVAKIHVSPNAHFRRPL